MPSLTSCYFCGDAVGASLDEYDLPAAASPDEQVTVTLCAGCEGKLTELLDEIAPSGGDAGSGTDPTAADAAGSSSPESDVAPAIDADLDPAAGDQEPIFADDGDAVLDEELPAGASVEERPFATDEADESADEFAAESADETDDAPDGTDDATVADDSSDPDDRDADAVSSGADAAGDAAGPDQPASDDAPADDDPIQAPPAGAAADDPDEQDAADGAEPAGSGATDGADGSGDAATAPPVEANAGGSGSATSTASGAGGSSADGPLADVSPRTYNRVVRLLQNREFPVDRADFEALATSAYELDHGECSAALDGAIEKGLLEERGGELHRPE